MNEEVEQILEDRARAYMAKTTQPDRQPLTDEELDAMWGEDDYPSLRFFMLAARAVERKHGIGGKP